MAWIFVRMSEYVQKHKKQSGMAAWASQ